MSRLLYGLLIGTVTGIEAELPSACAGDAYRQPCLACGDLIMSLVKRKFGIKDYGKLFPGHGGVLDRFDSVICVSPFIYFMTEFIPVLKLFS